MQALPDVPHLRATKVPASLLRLGTLVPELVVLVLAVPELAVPELAEPELAEQVPAVPELAEPALEAPAAAQALEAPVPELSLIHI